MRTKFFLSLILCAVAAPAWASGGKDAPATGASASDFATASDRRDIASLIKLAKSAVQDQNIPLAEQFFERMLSVQIEAEEKRDGMLVIGKIYEEEKLRTKAITAYERFVRTFPKDPALPEVLLSLGRLYRSVGAHQLALDRFYSVLNSVIKISEGGYKEYKSATLVAQFEIAETYFDSGDYTQAAKFYRLIKLLDLSREDQDRASFKSFYCQFLLGNYADTIPQALGFIQNYPASTNLPEARYILAMVYKATGRTEDSLTQVMQLLREEKANSDKNPEIWRYWQKKAGNQVANEFYKQGDFVNAITIYQSLAKVSKEPDWQWPAIYQMGICFERLRLPERAVEAYQYILDEFKKVGEPAKLPANLTALNEMAQWHIEHLKWQENTDLQLQSLLYAPEAARGLGNTIP